MVKGWEEEVIWSVALPAYSTFDTRFGYQNNQSDLDMHILTISLLADRSLVV